MTEYRESIDARKRRNGYIILGVVLVLFIIAFFTMKVMFQDRLDSLRAADAKMTIREIYEAAKKYEFDHGAWPYNLSELVEFEYWKVDKEVYKYWDFYLLGRKTIRAISTREMPGGSGRIINYDIRTDTFSGYGCPEGGERGHFEE